MIISIEGIDGVGKTTLIKKLFSRLFFQVCQNGKDYLKNILDGKKIDTLDEFDKCVVLSGENCCGAKCLIKLSHTNFEENLFLFKKSIRKFLNEEKGVPWYETVKKFVEYCKKNNELYKNLFFFSFWRISFLAKKYPSSIILVDRYLMSNIVYGLSENDYEKLGDKKIDLKLEIQKKIDNFNWELFPFTESEIKTFKLVNGDNIKYPYKTIIIDDSTENCIKNINKRSENIGVYESREELDFRRKVFGKIDGDYFLAKSNSLLNAQFVDMIASSIINAWQDKLIIEKTCPLLLKNNRQSQINLTNKLADNDKCSFSRYEIRYEGQWYYATSPTRILSSLNDFSPVTNHYLKLMETQTCDKIEEAIMRVKNGDMALDDIINEVRPVVMATHKEPARMLNIAGDVGKQTHAVIEAIIKHIINCHDGVVNDFLETNVNKIANELYYKTADRYGVRWENNLQWEMVSYFLDYQKQEVKKWIGSEMLTFDSVSKIAGTFDAIAENKNGDFVIVDFKTSKVLKKSHYAQIIFYYMLNNKYFNELDEKFKIKGWLEENDIALTNYDMVKGDYNLNSNLLNSLNRFFSMSKNKPKNKMWFTEGHIVHLDREKSKFKCGHIDFKNLEKMSNEIVFDDNFLMSLSNPIKLNECMTDAGYIYTNDGEKIKYVNFT